MEKLMRLGSWLGCHQRPDRSFFYKGHQFPLCARCTGAAAGQILAVGLWFAVRPNVLICAVFCGILLAVWLIQYLKIRESTNARRFVSGILGGYGLLSMELIIVEAIAKLFVNFV